MGEMEDEYDSAQGERQLQKRPACDEMCQSKDNLDECVDRKRSEKNSILCRRLRRGSACLLLGVAATFVGATVVHVFHVEMPRAGGTTCEQEFPSGRCVVKHSNKSTSSSSSSSMSEVAVSLEDSSKSGIWDNIDHGSLLRKISNPMQDISPTQQDEYLQQAAPSFRVSSAINYVGMGSLEERGKNRLSLQPSLSSFEFGTLRNLDAWKQDTSDTRSTRIPGAKNSFGSFYPERDVYPVGSAEVNEYVGPLTHAWSAQALLAQKARRTAQMFSRGSQFSGSIQKPIFGSAGVADVWSTFLHGHEIVSSWGRKDLDRQPIGSNGIRSSLRDLEKFQTRKSDDIWRHTPLPAKESSGSLTQGLSMQREAFRPILEQPKNLRTQWEDLSESARQQVADYYDRGSVLSSIKPLMKRDEKDFSLDASSSASADEGSHADEGRESKEEDENAPLVGMVGALPDLPPGTYAIIRAGSASEDFRVNPPPQEVYYVARMVDVVAQGLEEVISKGPDALHEEENTIVLDVMTMLHARKHL